jgi:pimeloyl-ACP methyl ester carboxylesterase
MEVSACVLINTSFGSFSPLHHRLRPRAWPTLAQLLLTRSSQKKEQLIFRVTSNLLEPPADLIDRWVAIREARPVSPGNAFRQVVAAARFQAPSQAPVPVLVLSSAQDRLVNPGCSRAIGHSWHCAIGSHPTAGHDLPLDDGAWVVAEIHRWLGGFESQGT